MTQTSSNSPWIRPGHPPIDKQDLLEVLNDMVTGVSASNAAYSPSIAEQSIHRASQAPSSSSIHEDTVSLSPAAQQAAKPSGDVDHDGDNH